MGVCYKVMSSLTGSPEFVAGSEPRPIHATGHENGEIDWLEYARIAFVGVAILVAILGAIGRAARRGAIVKGGRYLETLSRVDTVVLR